MRAPKHRAATSALGEREHDADSHLGPELLKRSSGLLENLRSQRQVLADDWRTASTTKSVARTTKSGPRPREYGRGATRYRQIPRRRLPCVCLLRGPHTLRWQLTNQF